MFVRIKLLEGFKEPLWYSVPLEHSPLCIPGAIAHVPLRGRTVLGVVEYITQEAPDVLWKLRAIIGFEIMPSDPYYATFIKKLAAYSVIDYVILVRRLRQFMRQGEKKELLDAPLLEQGSKETVQLTEEQRHIVDELLPHIQVPSFFPLLLHGVTGSGKTEIYKQCILETLKQNKSCMLLLPEVTLAIQFEVLLRAQLSHDVLIYGFHSGTGMKSKRALWNALLSKKPLLIIGVHLPVLLPVSNLGCIIVDEEHEVGYQEKKHPKINSKEAALLRAQVADIPILLGSGTPSITSLYNVHNKGWHYASLAKRFAGAFPRIEIVFLTDKKTRRNFWISTALEQAIKQQLDRKEQTIIFLNRRGYSFFVQCKECAFVVMCSYCSVSLTLHEDNQLSCHYCGLHMPLPITCSSCKAMDNPFLKKGIGTQQVVSILQKAFPQARIARADLDATINRKKWQKTVDAMHNQEIDILVGTQTITKGYHFPKVTLVGIIWADLNLHFPFYNAAETTMQQLIQVAGRAGRASQQSKVIIQTMIDHPIYKYLQENSYKDFYNYELDKRRRLNYPPFMRFAEIELKDTDEQKLELNTTLVMKLLEEKSKESLVRVLGPAKPPVNKIKNIHIRKIYLKAVSMKEIQILYQTVSGHTISSQISFTSNPLI